MSIELVGGGTIALRGADNYDSLRGDGLDFVVLDEYASMAPEAWSEVLRPALSDRMGRALFIGTPKGLNHFYDLYQNAQALAQWQAFRFEESRFSAHRNQGNCASSKAMASAVVCPGAAAHNGAAWGGVGIRAIRARRMRWLRPNALPPRDPMRRSCNGDLLNKM